MGENSSRDNNKIINMFKIVKWFILIMWFFSLFLAENDFQVSSLSKQKSICKNLMQGGLGSYLVGYIWRVNNSYIDIKSAPSKLP